MLRKSVVGLAKICFTLFVVTLVGYFITTAVALVFADYVTSTGVDNLNEQISNLLGF